MQTHNGQKNKKGMDRNFLVYRCIMANTSAILQHAAHTTDQLSSPSCLTGAIPKSQSLNKNYRRIF